MEILPFEGNATEITWPSHLVSELEALSPQDQLRYFYMDTSSELRTKELREEGGYGWSNMGCYYNHPVAAVELLDGKIAAVHYGGHRIQLGETVCTYSASDNNGAGYKERNDYASLICGNPITFPHDFYEVDGDTVTFNKNTPKDPYAFMYALVTPWQREATEPIRHVIIQDDVTFVPEYLLSSMKDLETVHQPAALNTSLVDFPGCQVYIGGIRMVDAFVSWDDILVRVNEDAEQIRVPGNIKELGAYAFVDCPSLKRVILPKSVTAIAEGTFAAFNDQLTIYCEAAEKPQGWPSNFERPDGPRVVWGYTE